MPKNRITPPVILLLAVILLIAGCHRKSETIPSNAPDLVIFTGQDVTVYAPIIKEYQERSGLNIQVISGTFHELQLQLEEQPPSGYCDVVFGLDAAALEYNKEYWEPYESQSAAALTFGFTSPASRWTPFSVTSLIIIYNTRVVTYRELPTNWNSLLEPRWRDRIAFMNPEISDVYLSALTTAMYAADRPFEYLAELAANLGYQTLDSPDAVTQAVSDGRCFVGITMEETAESLLRDGADIDYIFPDGESSIYLDGSAVVLGCRNPEEARAFIDFTVSSDVQHILAAHLYRRPVRGDVAPPLGLLPVDRLPEGALDREHQGYKTTVLTEWRQLMETHSK